MPRYIILFRHGKSDWNANYASIMSVSFKRGIKAAKMGRYLSNIDQVPGLTIHPPHSEHVIQLN